MVVVLVKLPWWSCWSGRSCWSGHVGLQYRVFRTVQCMLYFICVTCSDSSDPILVLRAYTALIIKLLSIVSRNPALYADICM